MDGITYALEFMAACGMQRDPELSHVELFSSHEGLVLDFEEAVTRPVASEYVAEPLSHFLCERAHVFVHVCFSLVRILFLFFCFVFHIGTIISARI